MFQIGLISQIVVGEHRSVKTKTQFGLWQIRQRPKSGLLDEWFVENRWFQNQERDAGQVHLSELAEKIRHRKKCSFRGFWTLTATLNDEKVGFPDHYASGNASTLSLTAAQITIFQTPWWELSLVSPSQLCASIFHSSAQILMDDHGFRKIPAVQINETQVRSVVKPTGEKKGIPLSPGKKESPLPDFWFLRKLRAFPRTDAKIKTHLNVSVQVDSR
jgi:hypothetical protein